MQFLGEQLRAPPQRHHEGDCRFHLLNVPLVRSGDSCHRHKLTWDGTSRQANSGVLVEDIEAAGENPSYTNPADDRDVNTPSRLCAVVP